MLAVIDAKGHDVFEGDTVVDCFGDEHKVERIVPQTAIQAYVVDQNGRDMMPWLTEKMLPRGTEVIFV